MKDPDSNVTPRKQYERIAILMNEVFLFPLLLLISFLYLKPSHITTILSLVIT